MAEPGVEVDHATLHRRITKYSSPVASEARRRKAPVDQSGHIDETHIKVKERDRIIDQFSAS